MDRPLVASTMAADTGDEVLEDDDEDDDDDEEEE